MTDPREYGGGNIQEISSEDLDQVSGGFIFLIALAAVALSGCFAHCGTPPVEHP